MLFRFHTVLPAGLTALALGFLAPAVPAQAQETPTEPTPAAAKPSPPSFTPPRPLDSLSKDELLVMVKDLTLRNQILTQRLVEQREDLASAEPDLQARIGFQARTIGRLTEELKRAQAQLAQAQAVIPSPQPAQPQDPGPQDQPVDPPYDVPEAGGTGERGGAGQAGGTTAEPEAAPAWEFRAVYAFGLLGSVNGGKVTLHDENGSRPRNEYDPREYRSDAMWIQVTLRNDSDEPTGFTGQVQLQGDASARNGGQRPVLAEETFTTPILQPGQIYQLNDNEYKIEQPWRVAAVALADVQGIAAPAAPDPDPS